MSVVVFGNSFVNRLNDVAKFLFFFIFYSRVMLVISLVLKFLEQLFVIKIGTLQHQVVQSWVKITRFSVKSD